jgi:hypothetical protein
MIFTAPGRFKSAPVVENVEVAAAAGGRGGGDDDDDDNEDDDDDDDGNVSSREDRKQKAPRGKPINLGPIKLVRGGGWCRKAMALALANSVL